MSIDEIRQAKDELIRMSNDDTQRELYEMRAKTLKDKISALNEAERKGMQKGMQKGIKEGMQKGEKKKALEIAKSMIDMGLDKKTISKTTGLDLYEIEKVKKQSVKIKCILCQGHETKHMAKKPSKADF